MILHFARCIRAAISHPRIALLGAREFRSSCGMTYDNDPTSPRSEAYDSGRELAHAVTLRRYDSAA